MPIIWILVVGALLFLALRMLEQHHRSANQKQSAEQPPTLESSEAIPPVDAASAPEESAGRPFIDTIPGLPNETKTELQKLNLTTPTAIRDTSDKKLLTIRGIGPARLKQIRALCADAKY